MENKLLITNIQRMCFHDGPGIRTTVFLKGCGLRCPWCSNPENLSFRQDEYENEGEKGVYGIYYNPREITDILIKDQKFWGTGGGVTFSGGEPLMQAELLLPVLKLLKERHIHTAVETALFVPEKMVREILPYIDYFIVDAKILDKDKCKEILGGDISTYFSNVRLLYQKGRLKLFRIPCCPEYTFTEKNKKLLTDFLGEYHQVPVQVFSVHNLGEKKYKSLGREIWQSDGVEQQQLIDFCDALRKSGVNAEVNMI